MDVIILNGESAEQRKEELKQIFGNPHILSCMEATLKNTDEPPRRDIIKHRRRAALKAFNAIPSAVWDMKDERRNN